VSNPLGLERSVSTGIISGIRKIAERELLQTTVPISSGSSGGPILDVNSEVVGVAVSALEKGQNLNFAVPARFVQDLIENRISINQGFDSIMKWIESRGETTDGAIVYAPKSEYQKAMSSAGMDPVRLLTFSARSLYRYPDVAIEAAEKAIKVLPNEAAYNALGLALGSMANNTIGQEAAILRNRAVQAFQTSIRITKQPLFESYMFLGATLEGLEKLAEAYNAYNQAFKSARERQNVDEQKYVMEALINTSFELKEFERANEWFQFRKDLGGLSEYDWKRQAERLESGKKDFKAAGEAYARAATIGVLPGMVRISDKGVAMAATDDNGSWYHWCSAANSYISASPPLADDALLAARACIAEGRGKENSEVDVSFAFRLIADILISRGLFEDGLKSAEEAFSLDGTNWSAQTSRGMAFSGLSRFQEAVDALQISLKLSDGAFASTHFALGNAYYSLKQWDRARQNFERAANLDTNDDAAAYNVALSCANLGEHIASAKWYKEVLRRAPNHSEKQEIERKIAAIRQTTP